MVKEHEMQRGEVIAQIEFMITKPLVFRYLLLPCLIHLFIHVQYCE